MKMLYGFMNEEGKFFNIQMTAPSEPICQVLDLSDAVSAVQCFDDEEKAQWYLYKARERHLAYADAFDKLSVEPVTQAFMDSGNYELSLMRVD